MEILIFANKYNVSWDTISWDRVYDFFRIKGFVYFISNPLIQETLLPAKIFFIVFTIFFFCAVMYFYINSSYIRYHYLPGFADIMSSQSSMTRQINSRWKKIIKRIEAGSENEYKLAIVEADDFLNQILENNGAEGETFEELVNSSKKIIPNINDILSAHIIRNSVVHNPDYELDIDSAKKILSDYEKVIKIYL